MLHSADPSHSVRHIRRRLSLLLMQAFGTVVLITAVLLIVLLSLFITRAVQGDSNMGFALSRSFEVYYLARGSWDGVGVMLEEATPTLGAEEMRHVLLLDETGQVVIDRGRTNTPLIGTPYTVSGTNFQFPVRVRGRQVGTLVALETPLGIGAFVIGLLVSLALPVALISFFTGMLTLLIGFLLARRVVTPLADVIAAAHSVATGDLSTRVVVRGPGDLRDLNDSFNRMAEALERNDRERRNWLADIAHELRTPLTVMRGKLEGIVDGVYPADEAHIAPVLSETYLLERLVEDLRVLTLAEMRQLHFDVRPVALEDLARQAAGLFEAEAAEKRIALNVAAEANLPTVAADPQRVGQVIGNLISNALRYAPETGAVDIRVRRAGAGVELAVSDNGPGVPEADLPRVFDRFWRGEKSRGRAAGGAGLGLAIARQLIEAQGGQMTARNNSGGGLCVGFTIQ